MGSACGITVVPPWDCKIEGWPSGLSLRYGQEYADRKVGADLISENDLAVLKRNPDGSFMVQNASDGAWIRADSMESTGDIKFESDIRPTNEKAMVELKTRICACVPDFVDYDWLDEALDIQDLICPDVEHLDTRSKERKENWDDPEWVKFEKDRVRQLASGGRAWQRMLLAQGFADAGDSCDWMPEGDTWRSQVDVVPPAVTDVQLPEPANTCSERRKRAIDIFGEDIYDSTNEPPAFFQRTMLRSALLEKLKKKLSVTLN